MRNMFKWGLIFSSLIVLFYIMVEHSKVEAGPKVTNWYVETTFAPPHNEPVSGGSVINGSGKVVRYRLKSFHRIEWNKK